MKKIICALLAVMAIGVCFAGCTDHNDGICDECGAEKAYQLPGNTEDDREFCTACWAKAAIDAVNSAKD